MSVPKTARVALRVGLLLSAAASPAAGQDGRTGFDRQIGSHAAGGGGDTSDIVVTGSRIGSIGPVPIVPVTTVSAADVAWAGTDSTADVLTDLGAVGVGATDANTQADPTSAGLNLVNLRRLGTQRTLVLVNGRRQVAGTPFTGAVDLNTIPAALIARTEITTGGASAVYGADAIGGVINIVLRDDFEGLEARFRGGVTARGDGASRGLTLSGGQNLAAGRGNVTASVFYDREEGVEAVERRYGANGLNVVSNPANTGNNDGIPNLITREDTRSNLYNTRGVVVGLPTVYTFNAAGTGVSSYDFGAIGNRNGTSIGGDGGSFERYDNLSLPVERYGASFQGHLPLAGSTRLFLEGRYTHTRVRSFYQPTEDEISFAAPTISIDNPFVPPDLRSVLRAAGRSSFQLYRINEEFGRRGGDARRDMVQIVSGLKGDVGAFAYEAFAGYGRTVNSTRVLNDRLQANFIESLDVVATPAGPACRSEAARARGCLPLNLFGRGNADPAAVEYSRLDDHFLSSSSLAQAGADVKGAVLDLPAGPLSLALGAEWRETRASTSPSGIIRQGLSFSPRQLPVSGRTSVIEAFGEAQVPVLRDSALGHEMSVQMAGRVSKYDVNGFQFAWNLGASYAPAAGLTFRVSRSRAVRAPNVGELFSPRNQNNPFLQDPCDTLFIDQSPNRAEGCAALGIPAGYVSPTNGRSTPTFVGGNSRLDPETADALTLGLVARPAALPGLSFSVDYYRIDVRDAIASIPAQTLLNNCVDQEISPLDNPNCAAITRDPRTSQVTEVRATNLNIGRLFTRGLDIGVSYGLDLTDVAADLPGRLTVAGSGTYIFRLRTLTDANNRGSEIKREGVLGDPKLEFLTNVTYAAGALQLNWRTHFIASQLFTWFAGIPEDQYDRQRTGARAYHDLAVSYDVTKGLNARLVCSNVFDGKPPPLGGGVHQGLNGGAIYPNLGARFFATLTFDL